MKIEEQSGLTDAVDEQSQRCWSFGDRCCSCTCMHDEIDDSKTRSRQEVPSAQEAVVTHMHSDY